MIIRFIRHIVYSIAYKILTPNQKIDLAKFIISDKTNEILDKEISTEPFYSFLKNNDGFSKQYCQNYIANFSKFKSQIGQDCFVDTYLNQKKNGFFIEIGVGNGVDLSNTYFLEKERNWQGVLVEPCQPFESSINTNRKAQLVKKAISTKSNQSVKFIENVDAGYLSGFENENTSKFQNSKSYQVNTINFQDLIKSLDTNQVIDYLSLDIEGNELSIIKSIDFKAIKINVVSVEHNKDLNMMKQLIDYMTPFGYKYFDSSYFDWEIIFYK